MKRALLVVASLALVLGASAVAFQEKRPFGYLDWPAKATAGKPRVAILIELGVKDVEPTDWSGTATIKGARVVHREGYRFRAGDKLTGTNGWTASSHWGLRAPPKNAAVKKMEPIATVGVVLHLEDITKKARLTVKTAAGDVDTPISALISGSPMDLWVWRGAIRRISVATPVTRGDTEDDFPAAAYGPDGTLWVAYVSYTLRDPSRRVESTNYKEQPKDFASLNQPGFADQVWLRSYKDGKWSEPIAITDKKQDIARCAVAVNGQEDVYVGYSAQRDKTFRIYARCLDRHGKLKKEERISIDAEAGPELSPVMVTGSASEVWLAYQSRDDEGYAQISYAQHRGSHWRTGGFGGNQNHWHPSLACADRKVCIAHDFYQRNYDVALAFLDRDEVGGLRVDNVVENSKFAARPSIVYDRDGRLWIAYEEGPEKWGKDFGSLVPDKGQPLYSSRSVRVVCIDTDGKLKRPVAELPTSDVKPPKAGDPQTTNGFENAVRYAYPKIGLDGKGRVWITYRRNFGSRYTTHPGPYWLTFARRLDGDKWSEEIELHRSDGLLDSRPAVLPHPSGGLCVIHNTDGRYTTPETIHNQVYMSVIDLPGEPVPPKLVEHKIEPVKAPPPEFLAEQKAVERIRIYRIEAAGKKYQLLRGEFHRHTEMSWDGAPDGSLEDMFRYAIDAAQFDWIGNGDHDNGAGREYSWWLTQKFSDAYHVPGVFTPMFTYERSVAYPHGHRNVMFAKRGILTLPRLAAGSDKAVGGVHPDDTKMLYRYLREHDGICASHTSATGMGTDWRDNDPAVEPIVEIYQGDRMSYEHEGAPRAGYDPKVGTEPANIAGWYPKGFINLALEKGYKLGFQASSDHWSTHISYMIVLAEKNERQAILDAVKKRHVYAATDNIIVDFKCGDKIMGDELTLAKAPTFTVHVHGTANLAKVEVLRDSEVIAKLPAEGMAYNGDWTDPQPRAGTHYYYVRVVQADGELAWGSPIWVTMKK